MAPGCMAWNSGEMTTFCLQYWVILGKLGLGSRRGLEVNIKLISGSKVPLDIISFGEENVYQGESHMELTELSCQICLCYVQTP